VCVCVCVCLCVSMHSLTENDIWELQQSVHHLKVLFDSTDFLFFNGSFCLSVFLFVHYPKCLLLYTTEKKYSKWVWSTKSHFHFYVKFPKFELLFFCTSRVYSTWFIPAIIECYSDALLVNSTRCPCFDLFLFTA